MNEELIEKAKAWGVDWDDMMERFAGNEDLAVRLLQKFPSDGNFTALGKAIEDGDAEAAFQAAHAFKGVVANLSLAKLQPGIIELTEVLRPRTTLEGTRELYNDLKKEYDALLEVLA